MNPWMTKGLLISRIQKNKLCHNSVKLPFDPHLSQYKSYRNLYFKTLTASKKLYFQKHLELNQTNAKKSWEVLRKIVNNSKKSSNSIQNIVVDGVFYESPSIIAEKFNQFFAGAAKSIIDKIPPFVPPLNTNVSFEDSSDALCFTRDPLSKTEVSDAILQLKDKVSQDANGLSSNFIKKFALTLSTPLYYVLNKSFSTGSVPTQLKTAKIIPFYKSGDSSSMDNYRPIAMLDVFSKVMEKIICNRLCAHLDKNELINDFQFGFRSNHSTLHPMLHFMNKITNSLEKKEHVVAIFCDLRKAFDCCNHKILLNKLFKMGIKGRELLWFQNYLCGRKQYVTINNSYSEVSDITIGVPQGSILGPILFIIYINDLPSCSNFLSLLFADDTTLLLSHSDINVLIQIVNLEFRKVVNFFRSHKLALHPAKTKFMLFSNSPNVKSKNYEIVINFNNDGEDDNTLIFPIERVSVNSTVPAIRFLGVYFDENLNFKYHIKLLLSKLSKTLYFLRSSKNFLTPRAMKAVYYSLFHSNLIYCIQIWSCTSSVNLTPISVLQKKAIRLISKSKYNAHSEPIFKEQSILPFEKLILFFNLQTMQFYTQGYLPISFNNVWVNNASRYQNEFILQLRNRENINIPFVRLTSSTIQPLVNLPRTWCQFPNENIKILRNKLDFKAELKKFLLAELASIVRCNRLLCPTCHLTLPI
jgi:hypothetical protein